jgi:hypothetical protein
MSAPASAAAAAPAAGAHSGARYTYWDVSSARVAERERLAAAAADLFVDREKFRAQADRLIALHGLAEWRKGEDVQAIVPLTAGNDGQIFTLFRHDAKYAVKLFKDGISHQLVAFHEALRGADGRFGADVLVTMRRAVVPIAWVQHKEQRCLVFEWIENDPDRAVTDRDRQSLRAQLDVIHALGFCHLDVTPRNILLAEDTSILMDYDCVTRIGTVPLCGIAPENSARVKRRDKVRVEDDEHLWRLLFPDADPRPAPASATVLAPAPAAAAASAGTAVFPPVGTLRIRAHARAQAAAPCRGSWPS